MNQKKFEELELRDDFVFGKVMRNKMLCKRVLETLLGDAIDEIDYPDTQRTINIAYLGKSVRLDVYVADSNKTVYNAEMQNKGTNSNTVLLPKRSRYYQGMVDLNLMERGMNYESLSKSYVIFICTFDPFGLGKYKYTFQNVCMEDKGLLLEDDAFKVFFNTKGNLKDAPVGLQRLLQYIEMKKIDDELTKLLDEEVDRTKRCENWRREYMKEIADSMDIKQAGIREGMKEGEHRINKLIVLLSENNRSDEIVKAARNEAFREGLFKEFNI